ncbi:hypothetical protein BRL54_08945 [Corynebacterium ulcerans]|nr:hypothetical protein BRL54_08945 [Corynebacterium ulcerans]
MDFGAYGPPCNAAYEVDNAIHIVCSECGARDGEYCEDSRGIKKIPHTRRLGEAYRVNNPEGRARHMRRQAHLAKHKEIFKATWAGG